MALMVDRDALAGRDKREHQESMEGMDLLGLKGQRDTALKERRVCAALKGMQFPVHQECPVFLVYVELLGQWVKKGIQGAL